MFEKLVKIQDIHGYETRCCEHDIYMDLSNKKLMFKSLFNVGICKTIICYPKNLD
jgi:hypothetical protein